MIEIEIPENLCALGRKIKIARVRKRLIKRIEMAVPVERDFIPVIQPRSFHCAIIQPKTGDANDMQLRICSRAETRDIARILRDFGLNEGDA